ncbi:crotonase/enoyl-CoA hydratase family protein [Pontivivens insulae]|uniref:Putative enoyl-CoA hydratase n=1 Tax=Pontivivens insulae TaxID=1639689 RepID=A0A2R8A8P9_9RHOB|nr:crotonase/enoyl-CoA hydratase family protein [Pontivivens insulae]RED18703.1 enoyl-CoA hydratase/carnithine racemase [Pontivivens insulae]SPF28601.1 putative enoyl-CoA hydratase [Pontivivens insulae]
MSRVSVEISDHIAHVTLTRGDKMNALDPAMLDAIALAGEQVNRDDVRAVVLAGEGRAFCAGLDVASFASVGANPAALLDRTHGRTNLYQQVALVWRDLPMPVIAALHHTCFGGGLQIALGADIRVAAPGTRMSIMEMKWGLVPDMGGMVLLPRLMPGDVMRRLIYTGEVFEAEQALSWGLVTELAEDPLTRAQALAQDIATKSPSAVRTAKALSAIAETADEDAVLMAESRLQADLIGKPHQMEAVMANMQKRAPKFE